MGSVVYIITDFQQKKEFGIVYILIIYFYVFIVRIKIFSEANNILHVLRYRIVSLVHEKEAVL